MPEKGRVFAIYRGKWVGVGVRRDSLNVLSLQTEPLCPVAILRDLFSIDLGGVML